jgi:hypothetical protein
MRMCRKERSEKPPVLGDHYKEVLELLPECLCRYGILPKKLLMYEERVAISNSTDTNSKQSETRQILKSTHFKLDLHKLENCRNSVN